MRSTLIIWLLLGACSGGSGSTTPDPDTTPADTDTDTDADTDTDTDTDTGFSDTDTSNTDTATETEVYWPWHLPDCVPTAKPNDCATSTPILITVDGVDIPSGYASCDDTCNIHRTHDADPQPFQGPGTCQATGESSKSTCQTDAECGDGRCMKLCSDIEICGCKYTCRSNADCSEQSYCDVLIRPFHACKSAGCRTDVDCPSGELCRRAKVDGYYGADGATLQCTTPKDSCDESSGEVCAWAGDRFVTSSRFTGGCDH